MSLIVQRAWRPTTTRPHRVATQRRFKMFERRVDKNNNVYYTLSKRRPVQDPNVAPSSQKFFEMPNLLLDLDAEGTRNVRTFDDKDEEQQVAIWRVNPKREQVKLKLADLESQLIESRKRAQDVAASPANIWRLSSHDLLAAALYGPPRSDSGAVTETPCPDTLEGSHLVDALRRENGIPGHVSASDALLLEWMLSRRYSTDSTKSKNNEPLLNAFGLVESLQSQTSIVGIRRLLRNNLWSFTSIKAYFGPSKKEHGAAADVASEIRRRCIDILGLGKIQKNQALNCLALVGGLLEKTSKGGMEPDQRLLGLALRVSPWSGSLVVLSEWIRHIHTTISWEECSEIVEDAAACIQSCSMLLVTQPETIADRQLLLQLLTGLDEYEKISAESLRSIILSCLRGKGSKSVASQVCGAYAKLLGELGAVRTLLKESESKDGALREACIAVLKGTLKYSETLKTQGVKMLSMEEMCPADTPRAAEAADDSNGPPSPESQYTAYNTKSETVIAVEEFFMASTESIRSPEEGIERQIELDEGLKVKDERQDESFTSQSSAGLEDKQNVSFKREATESSDAQVSFESRSSDTQYQQQWRRSAAPSPGSSVAAAAAAAATAVRDYKLIDDLDVLDILDNYPLITTVWATTVPCRCGTYEFVGLCGHVARTEEYKCRETVAQDSGEVVFCNLPVPRHIADAYVLNRACPSCLKLEDADLRFPAPVRKKSYPGPHAGVFEP
ncbi:hypothetical protein ISF_03605 [Cordyceps fumosorosea ARSEF 2679]|uniref:Uncharacterized protein n=1 Tax=Cordyceps fumosorosea (strain ARSEF 2679) TaxID=1081104 RepID=A0A167ZEV4_CORFA|nr:hypothetical protein ISF_03605 [Cordyceps fumosorosea ARSEF 2679]OAA67429.1 hypothetical protein ISF_03605 [Cordyceps fumosorosea ARSEF 2679]